MNLRIKILHWFPRVLIIIYILFISVFALDAFYGEASLVHKITDFLIHLIPSLFMILILLIAWQRELLGGLLFLIVGLIATFFYATFISASTFFCISCPLYLTGILFIISYLIKNRQKRKNNPAE